MTDLLALTAELVDVPSVSRDEGAITDRLENELRAVPGLTVERVGDNLVARTDLGRGLRVVLAGHTDTVPPTATNGSARLEGDTLWGVGSADMKAGVAVLLELARTVVEPAVDVSYIFYAREEISADESGLEEVFAARPELLDGDVAILGEPSGGIIEAGCQGTMRFEVTLTGKRAHSARPWLGRNAIHRVGRVIDAVEGFDARQPVIDGCEYREALQAVIVQGGIAHNVVPDRVELTLNHRFAPDLTADEAEQRVRDLLAPHLESGDEVRVPDRMPGAAPNLDHPVLATMIRRHALDVKAKLGWTDVARFAARGIPAANLGPGESTLAHTADERVEREPIERTYAVLEDLLRAGPDDPVA